MDDQTPSVQANGDAEMSRIVQEEERVLARILRHLANRTIERASHVDYDQDLVALRDEIGEARLEDVPALIAQMERLQQVAQRRAEVTAGSVDPRSPYFGRIVLQEGDKKREVLIGRGTYLDSATGVRIVDWRDAPVSRIYYRYEEGDDYDEEFGGRPVEGEVLARRTLGIVGGVLRRIGSPQGTFIKRPNGQWVRADAGRVRLSGGQGSALRPQDHHRPGQLGVGMEGGSEDKHLSEIAALIDPRQFDLITRPDSGLVVIQGGAGSGKTTIGLHRLAYLAFQQPRRFRPEHMLVVVFNDALARYISQVLPALGVDRVPVVTFEHWASKLRRQSVSGLPGRYHDDVPGAVTRLKKHPAMLRIIDDLAEQLTEASGARIAELLAGLPAGEPLLRTWRQSGAERLGQRLGRLAQALSSHANASGPAVAAAHALEREIGVWRRERLDVAGLWAELLTDRPSLRAGFDRHAPGEVSDREIDQLVSWSTRHCSAALGHREESLSGDGGPRRGGGEDDDVLYAVDGEVEAEEVAIDREDDTLLLRLTQRVHGPLRRGKERLRYQHAFVDETQDLSPVELAVVLDTVEEHSVTMAGDVAQRLLMENGFSDWKSVLAVLGLSHFEIEPLKLSYRSTHEIIQFALHVLGPLADPDSVQTTRHGAPVEVFRFGHTGEAVALLAEALRNLMHGEPKASVAVVARFPEQADVYHRGLVNAEVPHVRRITEQDFPFKSGIDVTDVRQVKGLEFDYVVLVEVSAACYGRDDEARHLLHIAATRASHQLWVTCCGTPSPLLPENPGARDN